jgi:hypothetical protein
MTEDGVEVADGRTMKSERKGEGEGRGGRGRHAVIVWRWVLGDDWDGQSGVGLHHRELMSGVRGGRAEGEALRGWEMTERERLCHQQPGEEGHQPLVKLIERTLQLLHCGVRVEWRDGREELDHGQQLICGGEELSTLCVAHFLDLNSPDSSMSEGEDEQWQVQVDHHRLLLNLSHDVRVGVRGLKEGEQSSAGVQCPRRPRSTDGVEQMSSLTMVVRLLDRVIVVSGEEVQPGRVGEMRTGEGGELRLIDAMTAEGDQASVILLSKVYSGSVM